MGAAGFRGSWPPVFPDNGGMLFNLNELELGNGTNITFNQATMEVTVSPGVNERDLQKFFFANNICFESDVIIITATYGGVVSSGSHGTGKDQPSVSDFLTELKIVNGSGEIVTYNSQTQGSADFSTADILSAAKVNLGLFGIAVEYTFKVIPMKYVLLDVIAKKVGDVFSTSAAIQTLWEQHWSLEISFFPFQNFNKQAATAVPYYDAPVTIRAVNDPLSNLPPTGIDTLQFGKNVSSVIVQQLDTALPNRKVKFVKLPDAIHYFDTMQWFPLYAMEFCFPYTSETVKQAMDAALNVIKKQEGVLYKKIFPLSILIDARFIQHSDTLLCPAMVGQKTTYSFYIQVLPSRLFYTIDTIQKLYIAIADEWFSLGGVPHWHKDWTFLTDVEKHIYKAYGWRMQKFEDIRQGLNVDPLNLFRNETMTKLFQPVTTK